MHARIIAVYSERIKFVPPSTSQPLDIFPFSSYNRPMSTTSAPSASPLLGGLGLFASRETKATANVVAISRPAPPPPALVEEPVDEELPTADEIVAQLLAGDPTLHPEFVEEPRRRGGPGRMPGSQNKNKGRLKYSHKALADTIIMNPTLTGKELAEIFGRTPQWVYIVQNSDAFQQYLSQRQAELVDPAFRATLKEKVQALASRSIDVMAEKLDRSADLVPDTFALRAFELASKAAALGGNAPPPPPPSGAEYLPEIVERLTRLRGMASGQVVDVPSREIPPASA